MDVVEFLKTFACFAPVWAGLTAHFTNKSISRKTGFETSPYRDFYLKSEITAAALTNYQNLVYSTLINDKQAKYPLSFKDTANQIIFKINIQRVLTDCTQLANYYYSPFTYKEKIFYSFSGIREVMGAINLVLRYVDVFARIMDVENSIKQQHILRFKILEILCQRYEIHPIEYALIKPIIERVSKTTTHFGRPSDHENLADYVEDQIRSLGKEQIKRALRDTVKVFWVDGIGCSSRPITTDIRVVAKPLDTFCTSPVALCIRDDFMTVDVVEDARDLKIACIEQRHDDSTKPLILKFKDFTMLPTLQKHAAIYCEFPNSFCDVLNEIFDSGIDAGEWVKYFFSRTRGTGYILFDEATVHYVDYDTVKLSVNDLPTDQKPLFYKLQKCMGEIFL